MKKAITLFFIIGILPLLLYAQNAKIDSLENKLSIYTQKDSIRVDLLNSLAFEYKSHDITKFQERATEANSLAKELGYEKGLANSILMFSKIHISKGEFNEALEDALESLNIYKETNNDNHKDIFSVYNTLGVITNYQNDPDTSVEYFKKALNIAKMNGNLEKQSSALCNIGVTYYSKGEFENAINFYQKSITIDEELGAPKSMLTTLNNIAAIYIIQDRYTEALDHYNEILILYKEDNKKDKIARTLQNIGIIYSKIEQYKKAYAYFQESLQIHKELEAKRGIAINLNSIGGVLVNLKEYKKGLEYLNESLSINKEVNNNESLVACYMSIGQVYIVLQEPNLALSNFKSSLSLSMSSGDKRNIGNSHIKLANAYFILKSYPKALYHSLEGKKIVDNLDMLQMQQEVNRVLTNIYENTGHYKKALASHKQFKTLNDSIFNKKNIEKITQLEYEYKYKQELELASFRELKLNKTVKSTTQNLEKSQRNLLLGVIAFLGITLILGTLIFFLRLKNEKSKTKNIVIEQKLLRSQMTPHFIFNSLSVLQGMILNKEEKKSVSYLSKFSKLLRIILENSRDKMVLLSQELTAIENYLALQNLENRSYKYTILIDDAIDQSLFKVPPMLMQPFVENAIEHAFGNQKENKKITIDLKYLNKKLICTIIDNGIGIDSQKKNKKRYKKSLSTTITSERLKMLSKDFKMRGTITIEDRQKYNEQGTIVTLVVPHKIDEV